MAKNRINQLNPKLEKRAGKLPRIVGHAAVFFVRNNPSGTQFEVAPGVVERIDFRAFDRALKERHDVRALVNHDPSMLLGRTTAGTLKLSIDGIGLRYELEPPDTLTGRDTLTLLKRGDLSGSSFGFRIPRDGAEFTQEDGLLVRTILSVILLDVSVVTYPSYRAATSSVRGLTPRLDHCRRKMRLYDMENNFNRKGNLN